CLHERCRGERPIRERTLDPYAHDVPARDAEDVTAAVGPVRAERIAQTLLLGPVRPLESQRGSPAPHVDGPFEQHAAEREYVPPAAHLGRALPFGEGIHATGGAVALEPCRCAPLAL